MRYVVAGATSDTGNHTVRLLADQVGAESITCLVRPTSNTVFLREVGVRIILGDVTDAHCLRGILSPATAYIDMTSPRLYHISLAAAVSAGVERAFFITTTAIYSRFNEMAKAYVANEALIRSSGICFTILRPSMIYGTPRDKNMSRLIRFLSRSPIVPIVDAGRSLMQPVHVGDLASGIVSAIGRRQAENQDYDLAGPIGISFRDVVLTIASTLHRRIRLVSVQSRVATRVGRWAQHLPSFPVTEEQILRLREDKVFDITKARDDLEYDPRHFAEGIADEVAQMRASALIQ